MAAIHTLSLRRVNLLRKRAARVTEIPSEGPEGWTPLGNEPARVLAVFTSLHLGPGFALRGYRLHEGFDGNAIVYAVPADQTLPEPGLCPVNPNHFLQPPVPPGALPDVMQAIDGDGTPWSYFSASIFARELAELGAMWHGCNWSTHSILGGNPLSDAAVRRSLRRSNLVPATWKDLEAWTWIQKPPDEWLPIVRISEPDVSVTFHTYSGLGQEIVYRHVDIYRRGSYCFTTTATPLAKGPGGYCF